MDSKLAFDTHVDATVKKANSTRAFLARNIPRCCRKVKQMAYTTYIRPTVEYDSPVLDPHTKRNTNKIEMVQCRCARNVTGNFDRTSSVTSLLNYLSWPNIGRKTAPIPPCFDAPHTSQPGGYPLAVLSHQNFTLHKGSQLQTPCTVLQESCLCLFFFFLALVKTGITLPSIQLMHHPLTPLPRS